METHIEELKRIMNESLNIKGRADQRAYITLFIFTFIVSSIASRLGSMISGIVMVIFFVPQLSMNIRRLHDTNISGKLLILPYLLGGLTLASFFLFFLNLPMFLMVIFGTSTLVITVYLAIKLIFTPSDASENKYGPPLKRRAELIDKNTGKVE